MENLKVIENELVPVYETSEGKKVVYGSDLHKVLGVKSRYNDWIRNRIRDCDAQESLDYEVTREIVTGNPNPKLNHIILLDTAKEMAMLERNDKGKEVRRYFIDIEKKYKEAEKKSQTAVAPMSQLEIAKLTIEKLIEQENRLKAIEEKQSCVDEEIKEINAKLEKHQENWYTIAGFASLLGMDVSLQQAGKLGKAASKIAKQNNIQLDKTSDVRYGKVNVYPRWILESVFENID